MIGVFLIGCWRLSWLKNPSGEATAFLRDGRVFRCQLDDATQRTMYLGLFEPTETRLIKELLAPGSTFLDIGAHIGWFSTMGSLRVGDSGSVIAFEPFQNNLKYLKANLLLNNCANVRVLESALGSEAGTLTLHGGSDSGAVTALAWIGSLPGVDVPVTTLDEVATDFGAVTLMKIDVEGWETNVLRGSRSTLSRTKFVLIEMNDPAITYTGSSREEIFDLLRDAGFSHFFRVNEGGLRRFVRSEVTNVLAIRSSERQNSGFWGKQGLGTRTARRLELLSDPSDAWGRSV
jgi:FkbM family methyltransferase